MSVAPHTVPFLDLTAQHDEIRTELDETWFRISRSNSFIGGPDVECFESAFAAYCGVSHCVGVANGTDALTLTLDALGIGIGDEVIVPANTFVATVEAVVAVGATPVFVDVDEKTLLVTADDIADVLSPQTAAVVVVHLYGQTPEMDAICAVVERAGIALVEDAAQAHGAAWLERRAGSFGHAAAFSFYPGKNLGAFGDAGAVTTNDPALSHRIRTLADHGRTIGARHVHDVAGCNSRLDALQAAILSIKLERLEYWNGCRRKAADHYRSVLTDGNCSPIYIDPRASAVHHLEVVRVHERERLLAELDGRGIGWGLHYPAPVYRQGPFAGYARRPFPVTDRAADQVVSLPMFPTITTEQIEFVCDALFAVTEGCAYGYAG
jgi:dTDP-4-amino-4,6-dideoxygalactose transaminase